MGFALQDPEGNIIFRSTLEETPENVLSAAKQHAANMRSKRQRELLPGQTIGPASDDVSQRMRDLSIGFSSQYDPAASLLQQGVGGSNGVIFGGVDENEAFVGGTGSIN